MLVQEDEIVFSLYPTPVSEMVLVSVLALGTLLAAFFSV